MRAIIFTAFIPLLLFLLSIDLIAEDTLQIILGTHVRFFNRK
jgi:hypothetical protein